MYIDSNTICRVASESRDLKYVSLYDIEKAILSFA